MSIRPMALAAVSGFLLAVSFPTINLSFIAWFALVPLLLALRGQSIKTAFWLGELAGIVYFGSTVYWITNSVHFYGGIPLIPASLITLLLCTYLALYPALFAASYVHIMKNRPALLILAAPLLWTALELGRTYVFSGFPWSLLGYTQYRVLPVIQISDITGVYGVSFLIVMMNVSVAEFFLNRKNYPAILTAVAALAITLAYGYACLQTKSQAEGINVTVVQGNIEQDKKWDPTYQEETFTVYRRLTLEALKRRSDLVIWPETSTPFYFNGKLGNDRLFSERLMTFVKHAGVPLLFGSPTYEVLPNRHIISRNSAFLLSSEGRIDAEYSKMHLVPFGEYVPLKHLLFFISKLTQAVGDMETGHDYTVMTVHYGDPSHRQEVRLCTLICYEIIFPDEVRKFVDKGAMLLTTITNDAWFGKTSAPYQHFSMAVFRAVENRVPVARAANTGISGFIDSYGHILKTSEIFTEAYLTCKLVPGPGKTFYTRHGDLFSYVCAFFAVVIVAFIPRKKPVRK